MPGILVSTLVSVIAALAENPDWYPRQCGAVDYCAPVINVTWISATEGNPPRMRVASVHGNAIVRNGFTVSESADAHFHVCMRFDPFGDMEVTCLLVPSQML